MDQTPIAHAVSTLCVEALIREVTELAPAGFVAKLAVVYGGIELRTLTKGAV